MKYLFAAAIFLLHLLMNLPVTVFAHGVDIADMTGLQDVRTVKFSYTDGTPMLFAKVKVFPPSSPDAPAQESIADRDGCFSFVPFEDGPWRLTAEDGMGHKGEITVTVAGETETEAGARNAGDGLPSGKLPAGKLPAPFAAVLGLSLIANVFGLWYLGKKKFPKKEAAHAH
ncbi:MAG: hypothetical protein LBS57_01190 [Treponema sp.]|jgi:nickel transport protein|nr:hypothetical protein [Treponema sp.]